MKSWEDFLRSTFGYTEHFQLHVAEELQQLLGDVDSSKVAQLLGMLSNTKMIFKVHGNSASMLLEAAMNNGRIATVTYLKTMECPSVNAALRNAAKLLKS
jgi:hypothetical protein